MRAAILRLARRMSLEWAPHRIRANAICPGMIATDAAHHRRPGHDAGYTTGTSVTIDGGVSALRVVAEGVLPHVHRQGVPA